MKVGKHESDLMKILSSVGLKIKKVHKESYGQRNKLELSTILCSGILGNVM